MPATIEKLKKKLLKKDKYVPSVFDLALKKSRTGLGLFATTPIKKGTCIIEYVGPVVPEERLEGKHGKYFFEISKNKTIDGAVRYNRARYINHSCIPNCEVEIWKERIFILAKRNIRAGEELNYDYDTEYFEEIIVPMGCKCLKCMPA